MCSNYISAINTTSLFFAYWGIDQIVKQSQTQSSYSVSSFPNSFKGGNNPQAPAPLGEATDCRRSPWGRPFPSAFGHAPATFNIQGPKNDMQAPYSNRPHCFTLWSFQNLCSIFQGAMSHQSMGSRWLSHSQPRQTRHILLKAFHREGFSYWECHVWVCQLVCC